MKLVFCKNHLGGQILYRSLEPPKKRRQSQATSIFTQKQQVKNDSKKVRKSRKEQEEIINNCYAKLKLCAKGNIIILSLLV